MAGIKYSRWTWWNLMKVRVQTHTPNKNNQRQCTSEASNEAKEKSFLDNYLIIEKCSVHTQKTHTQIDHSWRADRVYGRKNETKAQNAKTKRKAPNRLFLKKKSRRTSCA